ncbi:MAG: restriction endonuclease, partial [Candidatus Subteraquimicrobiales bacterium]|nr:restriction endonuclease [Candidatus Subteraquimicrobiales bacterium]
MARKNESILDLLVLLPWWVSVALSGISYLVLKYFVPSIEFQQKGPADIIYIFLKGFAGAAPSFAPIIAILLLIPAPISAINSWRKRKASHPFSSQISSSAFSPRLQPLKSSVNKCHDLSNKGIDLSIETLKKIEWYTFELFCKIYYENIEYRVTKTKAGADGGKDLLLYENDSELPCVLVQCKSRVHRDIGVNYVRELLGVMTSEKVNKGVLITNSRFTREAIEFAKIHPIELIDIYKLSSL